MNGGVAMYNEIKEVFNKKFKAWEVLDSKEGLYLGDDEKIINKNWKLNWVMQENEKGTYIEYYGIHHDGMHLHGRIYDDGTEESLSVLKEYIAYSPNIPGDREKGAAEWENYNGTLMKELKKKGLL